MKQNLSILPVFKAVIMDEMREEYEKKKQKRQERMLSILDYTMGIVMLAIGVFFLFLRDKPGFILNDYLKNPNWLDKVLGASCLLYGSWRIYRGWRKKYFR
jgi:threonine/homoserine/homoserine lactone efflux protein